MMRFVWKEKLWLFKGRLGAGPFDECDKFGKWISLPSSSRGTFDLISDEIVATLLVVEIGQINTFYGLHLIFSNSPQSCESSVWKPLGKMQMMQIDHSRIIIQSQLSMNPWLMHFDWTLFMMLTIRRYMMQPTRKCTVISCSEQWGLGGVLAIETNSCSTTRVWPLSYRLRLTQIFSLSLSLQHCMVWTILGIHLEKVFRLTVLRCLNYLTRTFRLPAIHLGFTVPIASPLDAEEIV